MPVLRATIRRKKAASSAFTLVELLVSMFILSILVLVMGQMLTMTEGAWSLGEANKERMQNARAISGFIGNELRAALLPINRTSTTDLQFVVNPPALTAATFNNRDSIFWQVPLATDQTLGDVAEVGYFVQWDTTKASNPHSQLCRFFVNHGTGTVANTNFLIYSNPTAWLTDSIVKSVASGKQQDAYQGLFAENILGLWVKCLDPLGNQITKDAAGTAFANNSFDSRRGYSYTDSSQTPTNVVMPICSLPSVIEISLVTLDSRSSARVETAGQTAITQLTGTSSDAAAFVSSALTNANFQKFRQGMRSYQTRIYLQASK